MDIERNSPLLRLLEDEFMCPIYKTPIHNPVITPVGITYEKEALDGWLDVNGVEPQSKKPLDKASLIQNLALKGLVSKIYREVPKLERSLTGKDEVIANLTEEVAQLRSELEYERQKCQENEDLMECTLEKTKKIRKIQENVISQKEMEKAKLKQKVKEITKLKMDMNEAQANLKILHGEIGQLKNATQRIKTQLTQGRKIIENQSQNFLHQLQNSRALRSATRQFQMQCLRGTRSQQAHRQYVFEYLSQSIGEIVVKYQENNLNSLVLQRMINTGVDKRMEAKRKQLLDKCTNQYRKNLVIKISYDFRNKVLIHRYLMKRRIAEKLKQTSLRHTLTSMDKAVGYQLQFLPYSIPPTEQQLQIDWSKTIKLVLTEMNDQKWQILMSQIHKFPKLVELYIDNCTIQNLTEAQLSVITSLKFLSILNWSTLNEKLVTEMTNYQNSHPEVFVRFEKDQIDVGLNTDDFIAD